MFSRSLHPPPLVRVHNVNDSQFPVSVPTRWASGWTLCLWPLRRSWAGTGAVCATVSEPPPPSSLGTGPLSLWQAGPLSDALGAKGKPVDARVTPGSEKQYRVWCLGGPGRPSCVPACLSLVLSRERCHQQVQRGDFSRGLGSGDVEPAGTEGAAPG